MTAAVDVRELGALVRGLPRLQGSSHTVFVDVRRKTGQDMVAATVRQTALGISPESAAGGTVRVKDEVKVEFQMEMSE